MIDKVQDGPKVLYVYQGLKAEPRDASQINIKLRAQALHAVRGRCGKCGRSIEKQDIVLVVDHRLPREWGGEGVPENLWAICKECNAGKKNYFKWRRTRTIGRNSSANFGTWDGKSRRSPRRAGWRPSFLAL